MTWERMGQMTDANVPQARRRDQVGVEAVTSVEDERATHQFGNPAPMHR